MKDIQSLLDKREVYLNEVGIRGIKYPVELRKTDGSWYTTPAVLSLRVDLPETKKGTHMSRFVEVLQEHARIEFPVIKELLVEMKERLEAVNSYFDMEFTWFVEKESPVSGQKSLLDVQVRINAELMGDEFRHRLSVNTPVTTLCPCSKEISDYSAHNQRANVIITVDTPMFLQIEDLVKIAEDSASSPLYSLLKRPDEKYVTEYAYDHPKFVEDVCRDAKLKLDEISGLEAYSVEECACKTLD